jgi:hypothetical protein
MISKKNNMVNNQTPKAPFDIDVVLKWLMMIKSHGVTNTKVNEDVIEYEKKHIKDIAMYVKMNPNLIFAVRSMSPQELEQYQNETGD